MIKKGGPMNHGKKGGSGAEGPKAKNAKGSLLRLLDYMGKYKLALIAVMVFAIASAIFTIYGPTLLGKATTAIFEGVMGKLAGTSAGIDFGYIRDIIILLGVLYALSALFSYLQGFIMTNISTKVSYRMRKDILEKINRMPLKYFDGTNHGEVLSRVTNDVDTVSRSLSQSITQVITSATTVVGVLIMMLRISGLMTTVALAMIPLSLGVVMVIVKRSQKYFKQQQVYLGNANGHIEEMYSGHMIVKAFNGEERSKEKFEKFNNNLYESSWKSQFLSGMMMPVMNIISNIGYVGVCVLGGALAASGQIAVGEIQAFVQYVRNFTQPISQLANVSSIFQQTAAAAERVFEFMDEDEQVPEAANPVKKETVEGNVGFKNVSFGYNEDNIILNDFSVDVKPGQKIAIVGPTGAGKSTMIKLLMRFYDVNSGSISIDGDDIRDYTREDLRKMFGMVLQETWLYNGSIMENIRYGRLNATDEEVIEAAKAANVDRFVHALPGGYDMILNEDASNVSQGQKQLITIARAILSNPKILILDEATSSVDTRTEVQIQEAMNNLMEGRTSFVIAHRLSTIKDADIILVMNKGDIIEQGPHDELMALDGFYANLYNSQFETDEVS